MLPERGRRWMLIENIILTIMGLASGVAVAGGVFAFIIVIGVIPRLAGRTHTAWAYWHYENMVILGGFVGNLVFLYETKIPIGYLGLGAFGIFTGIYVGCFAVALAEVLNVVPIFSRRIRLKEGFPFVVLSIAIGKLLGAIYQLIIDK